MTKSKKYIYLACLGLLLLGVLEIWINNTLVTFGAKYEKITMLQEELMLENQLLEEDLAIELSLVNIATKSVGLGFLKPKDVKYLR